MGRLGSITRRELIAYNGALGGFIALALACVFCLFAIGGCADLREEANRRQSHTKAEAEAAAAVAMAYTLTEEGANVTPDTPDNPEPGPTPEQCENCGGSGWVGDGRVFSPCLECNPDGKKPRTASVVSAVDAPTPDPWPNAPEEILEDVAQRVVDRLLPDIRAGNARDVLLNNRIDTLTERVDVIAEQVDITAEAAGARVPDKPAADKPKPETQAANKPLFRIIAIYCGEGGHCPPCERCKRDCEPAYRNSPDWVWESRASDIGPYPRYRLQPEAGAGPIIEKVGYTNREEFDAWVKASVAKIQASPATPGTSK